MTSSLESKCNYVLEETYQERRMTLIERRDKITFLIVFLFSSFMAETILRWPLYNFSLQIMEYFNPGDTSWCGMLEYMAYPEFYEGKIFFLLVVVNFKNEYAGIIFLCLTEFSTFLNGILKLFYLQARPFWIDTNLLPCQCFANYGNPSTTAINAISIFIVIHRIFKKKTIEGEISWHNIFLKAACLIGVISTCSSRFFGHAHSLNQILFGFCIGYSLYYLVFEIFQVDVDCKSSYRHFLLSGVTKKIMIGIFILNIIVNLIHYLLKFQNNPEWLSVIQQYCEFIPFNFFDNESYQKSCAVFLAFSVVISTYLEYIVIFNSDFDKYYDYNNNTNKNIKWNDTSGTRTIIRFILVFLSTVYIARIFFSSGDLQNDSILKLLFYRFVMTNIVVGIYVFLIVKFLLRNFGLTNELVFLQPEIEGDNEMKPLNNEFQDK